MSLYTLSEHTVSQFNYLLCAVFTTIRAVHVRFMNINYVTNMYLYMYSKKSSSTFESTLTCVTKSAPPAILISWLFTFPGSGINLFKKTVTRLTHTCSYMYSLIACFHKGSPIDATSYKLTSHSPPVHYYIQSINAINQYLLFKN